MFYLLYYIRARGAPLVRFRQLRGDVSIVHTDGNNTSKATTFARIFIGTGCCIKFNLGTKSIHFRNSFRVAYNI